MNDFTLVDHELYIYEDYNYSSITFAPLPDPTNLNQAITNLSKYIDWANDDRNDLKGKNNSLIQGSKIILLWNNNKYYQKKISGIINSDDKNKIYQKMLSLSLKKNN